MRHLTIVTSMCLLLTACASLTSEQKAYISKLRQSDFSSAPTKFGELENEACSSAYKSTMHDPSSLEWVSEWRFSEGASRPSWHSATQEQVFNNKYVYPPRTVTFIRQLRGKNSYGGLVLGTAWCMLYFEEDSLKFSTVYGR